MKKWTRRSWLGAAFVSPMAGWLGSGSGRWLGLAIKKSTDVRIENMFYAFEDFLYRTPYQFGGRSVDRVTLLNVTCRVRTLAGRSAKGFGSMTLGNLWAFPSSVMTYDTTLGAMKTLAERVSKITADCTETGHPIDLHGVLEPEYLKAAAEVSKYLKLLEPIPKLCTLVVASPFDAAIHDAFGKLHGLSCYRTYGPEWMTYDLSHYLGAAFKKEYLSQFILPAPKARIALYHSVGAGDALVPSDIRSRLNDGLPETLPEWIRYNGLTHLKIKLNGGDLQADVTRTLAIDRVATETQKPRGVEQWLYCLDFNERCPNVDYLLEFLRRIKEKTPSGFDRIQYVEQPTARDLKANRANVMHEAAKLRPIVIDESLTDYESLILGREMGYTGVALKACKGQSQAMLMAAAAQKHQMFLCVQDLTCPGASFLHSAGIAAHAPGVTAMEANARQYVPAANQPWVRRFPGMFKITDGAMKTAVLNQPGLGVVEPT